MKTSSLAAAVITALELKHLGPRLAHKALAWGLMALAILCLAVTGWRILEIYFGPLLGPLLAALVFSLAATGVCLKLHFKEKRRAPAAAQLSTAAMMIPIVTTLAAPLALPVLRFVLHPKRLAMIATGVSLATAAGMVATAKPSPRAQARRAERAKASRRA